MFPEGSEYLGALGDREALGTMSPQGPQSPQRIHDIQAPLSILVGPLVPRASIAFKAPRTSRPSKHSGAPDPPQHPGPPKPPVEPESP